MSITKKTVYVGTRRFVCINSGIYAFPCVGEAPTKLTHDKHLANILSFIKQGDVKNFKESLQYDMQCSSILSYQGESWHGRSGGLENNDACSAASFELEVMPFVEWTYLYKKNYLQQIVQALIESKNIELYHALAKSVDEAQLSDSSLFGWSESQEERVRRGLNELNTYGEKLEAKNVNKGRFITDLVTSLSDEMDKFHFLDRDNMPHFKANLEVLNFKLKFADKLHSQDELLSEHRYNYLRIITNLLSFIFSACIGNILHKAVTGNWLFFSQTTSKEGVDKVHHALEPQEFPLIYRMES